jgi:MFS family permease
MEEFPLYRAAFAGLLAMLVGLGIARFGYAPLVPALIAAHWFSAATAFWLGALNFFGYLLGAFGMRSWRRNIHTRWAAAGLVGVTAICLLASAWNAGVAYAAVWRLLSGITGGALMVLMGAAVVGQAPPEKRGQVGGITFAGMGTGITLSGLLIPKLLPFGLPATWAVLGVFSLAATVAVALLMPQTIIKPAPKSGSAILTLPVGLLMASYALCAVGFVPHMLFLASYVAIGLHRGVAAGAGASAVLGLAAACGPPVLGRVADRFGFLKILAIGYAVMAASVALPLLTVSPFGLAISAAGVGAVALATVMLTSAALSTMMPASQLAATWGLATMIYAGVQAASAAGFSSLYHVTGSFLLLFGIGAVAILASALLVAASMRSR